MALEGDEMGDANELTEQLRALLVQHGPAELLRAVSVGARELAEESPHREDALIAVAATTAQVAEAISDGVTLVAGDDGAAHDDSEAGGEESPPAPQAKARAPHEPPPSPNEGAPMKNQAIVPPRKDVTHWRVRRLSEDRKKSTQLFWGADGVEASEWPVKELSIDTLRHRWGVGRYVIFWFGRNEEGQSVPLGRGNPIDLLELPGELPQGPERLGGVRIPGPPEVGPSKPSASGELLALAAMRSQAGAGDMSAMLQLLAFMDERQERARQVQAQEARLAAERYRADLEVMLERERLASKERIAQIEATAQATIRGARGGGGLDVEMLGEVIGRKVTEAIAPLMEGDDDDASTSTPAAIVSQPSDLATTVNALKETLAPFLAAIASKVMQEPSSFTPPRAHDAE